MAPRKGHVYGIRSSVFPLSPVSLLGGYLIKYPKPSTLKLNTSSSSPSSVLLRKELMVRHILTIQRPSAWISRVGIKAELAWESCHLPCCCRIQGLGFQDSGFRVWGHGSGFNASMSTRKDIPAQSRARHANPSEDWVSS